MAEFIRYLSLADASFPGSWSAGTIVNTQAATLIGKSGTPQRRAKGTVTYPISETVFGPDGRQLGSKNSEMEVSADLIGGAWQLGNE